MIRFATPTRGATLQRFLPYALAVLCVLLYGVPLGLVSLPSLALGLFLAPLFVVCLQAESDRAPIFFALLGLMADILMEAPLGYWVFLTTLFYILSSEQKQVLQNATLSSQWLSFAIVVLIVYLTGFGISLMRSDLDVQFGGYLVSALLTGLSYPLLAWPLNKMIVASGQEIF